MLADLFPLVRVTSCVVSNRTQCLFLLLLEDRLVVFQLPLKFLFIVEKKKKKCPYVSALICILQHPHLSMLKLYSFTSNCSSVSPFRGIRSLAIIQPVENVFAEICGKDFPNPSSKFSRSALSKHDSEDTDSVTFKPYCFTSSPHHTAGDLKEETVTGMQGCQLPW